jgi:hypothetical protein
MSPNTKRITGAFTMKTSFIALSAAAVLAAFTAMPVSSASPAQERRAQCRQEAGERVGADRKAFIATCVSAKKAAMGKVASPKQSAQRAKMKACSEEFKIAGQPKSARRGFISACMKRV